VILAPLHHWIGKSDSDSDGDINIVSSVGMDISNGFVKDDPIKNLEPCKGVRVLTYVPQNPGISEAADRFCGDNMFSIFVQLSNLHHSQNINKFKTSPQSLKWDIMDKMKGHVPIIILMRQVKGQTWRLLEHKPHNCDSSS
jgi:hypothetical protein